MLYLFETWKPNTIFTASSFTDYHFFWRSGRGRHCAIITSNPEVIEKEFKERYGEDVKPEVMPKEPERFFEILRKFIDFDWRYTDDRMEIATVTPGKMIGKKGRNIRAIKKHLGVRNIKVTKAWIVNYDTWGWDRDNLELPDGTRIKLQKEELVGISGFHGVVQNGKVVREYLTPWKYEYLLDRVIVEKKVTTRYKSCGHERVEILAVEINRRDAAKVKDEVIEISKYCNDCCERIVREAKTDFDGALKNYGSLTLDDAVNRVLVKRGLALPKDIRSVKRSDELREIIQKIEVM